MATTTARETPATRTLPAADVSLDDIVLLTADDSLGANLPDERLDEYVRCLLAEVRRVCGGETVRFRIVCEVMLRPGQQPCIILSREGDLDGALGRRIWQALLSLPAPSPAAELVMFQMAVRVNDGGR